jgi:hypothetical protein
MNLTILAKTWRFTQPLRVDSEALRQAITGPFFETPLRPAAHDMLLLNAHHDLLPEPAPLQELTFFNLDRP